MCSDENTRKPVRNDVKCRADSDMPSGISTGSSSADTVGSPTQPRPSEAMVMPSWQQAR